MYSNLTGLDVVLESARRQCIWKLADSDANPVLLWNYLESLEATGCNSKLNNECLKDVFSNIKLDYNEVYRCMFGSHDFVLDDPTNISLKNELLQGQIDLAFQQPVTDLPQVFINGNVLDVAELTTASIFQALCDGYPDGTAPAECDLCRNCASDVNICIQQSQCDEYDDPGDHLESPHHDLNSGFGKLSQLVVDQKIFPYQMIQTCQVDFRSPGPLVKAILAGDRNGFASGAETCLDVDERAFKGACLAFEQCAGFDVFEFAQSNSQALGESFFGCLDAFETSSDTSVAVDKCVNLALHSGLWKPVWQFLEYSSQICPCIDHLSHNLPDCTFYEETPNIPLDGPAVKLSTCLLGQLCNTLEPLCQSEVDSLNGCLPLPPTEGEDDCATIEQLCKDNGSLLFLSPAPLAGTKFPLRCQSAAKRSEDLQNAHVIERYNEYRHKCVLKEVDYLEVSEEEIRNEKKGPEVPEEEVLQDETVPDNQKEVESKNDEKETAEKSSTPLISKSAFKETALIKKAEEDWTELPYLTRELAAGVAVLAFLCCTTSLYACYRAHQRYRYSQLSMSVLGDGSNVHDYMKPYKGNYVDEEAFAY